MERFDTLIDEYTVTDLTTKKQSCSSILRRPEETNRPTSSSEVPAITTTTTTVALRRSPIPASWRHWIAPAAWMLLNFVVSTDLFSSDHTSVIVAKMVQMFHLHIANLEALNAVLRKAGHFSAYAVLGLLTFRSWRLSLPERRTVSAIDGRSGRTIRAYVEPLWTLRWSVLAVAVCGLWAALDEFHQSFVPTRTASPYDVLLDVLGAIFLQIVLMLWWMEKTRPVKTR